MTFTETQLRKIRYDVELMKRRGLIKTPFNAAAFRSEVMKMRSAGLITERDKQPVSAMSIVRKRSWVNTHKQKALLIDMSDADFEAALAKATKEKNPQAKRWRRWRERGLKLKETKLCACGCGTVIKKYRKDLEELFYALNHHLRKIPSEEQRRIEQAIISSLTEPKTCKQLLDETRGMDPKRVYNVLWGMYNEGSVERIEYGLYRMPKVSV